MVSTAAVVAAALLPVAAQAQAPSSLAGSGAGSDIGLEYRGEVILDQGLTVDGYAFGGISGLRYDAEQDL